MTPRADRRLPVGGGGRGRSTFRCAGPSEVIVGTFPRRFPGRGREATRSYEQRDGARRSSGAADVERGKEPPH